MSTISAGTTTTTALVETGDTTGALVLQTGSGSTTALTLSSTQTATFAGAVTAPSFTTTGGTGSINSINTFGFKNRIINGGMTIDQRNAGASVTPTDGQFTLDRWISIATAASKFSIQQNAGSVTPPTGFSNYLGITSLSAYSVGTGDIFGIQQRIEGFNSADLQWGTANAKTITLSAWVYSSLTGTFGGALINSAQNYSYPFTYTISSANTWTQISVTIAGPTAGTWIGATNGSGIQVNFGIGGGSTYSGTAGAWAAQQKYTATGGTSVVGTNGATFYITGVQLEVGSQATSFDFRSFGTELALCQRYYEKSYSQGTVPASSTGVGACWFPYGGVNCFATFPFAAEKRTDATMLVWDTAGNSNKVSWGDGSAAITTNVAQGVPVQYAGTRNVTLRLSNGISGTPVVLGYQWTASAEL